MSSLSTILSEIEASAEKMKTLEAELVIEKEHSKTLVEQYKAQSVDVLKSLGIEDSAKERKPRTHEVILIGAANRSIRQSVKAGEKNAKTILAAALEAADKTAKAKLGLADVPAEIKLKIEERLKKLVKK